MENTTQIHGPIPADDPTRHSVLAKPNEDASLRHVGVVGDTYTILLDGGQTDGHYCLIDMHIPPGGGPPPHRHDFEETFSVLEGEIAAIFRGEKMTVKAGETLHVPANAPHSFTNATDRPVRLLCTCSASGQEAFFLEVGVLVDGRTTAAPKPTEEEKKATVAKTKRLAPKYRIEMLAS